MVRSRKRIARLTFLPSSLGRRTAVLAIMVAIGVTAPAGAETAAPAYIASAVADPARPAVDVARDPFRKPAEMMVFADVKPGQTVIELLPGKGYFTRILSRIVGPAGHVYAATIASAGGDAKAGPSLSSDPAYANVTDITLDKLGAAAPADVVWTAQNYHDFHLTRLNMDVPAFDRQVFSALKPGGEFIVIDHAAIDGSGLAAPNTLHRIDEAVVKQEVESAGFVLEGEIDVLRNPADPRTAIVFDPSIRGHTDQFVLRFRKPAEG